MSRNPADLTRGQFRRRALAFLKFAMSLSLLATAVFLPAPLVQSPWWKSRR